MPDPIKPTQADREALERIDDALGFLMDNEREIVLQAVAIHAQQAREQALEEAAKVADHFLMTKTNLDVALVVEIIAALRAIKEHQLEAAATLVTEWLDRINDRDGTALGGPQWFELGRAVAKARAALRAQPAPASGEVRKLVERLRSIDHMNVEECFLDSHLFAKAADMLERLAVVSHETGSDDRQAVLSSSGDQQVGNIKTNRLSGDQVEVMALAIAKNRNPGLYDGDAQTQHRAASPHTVEHSQARELELAREDARAALAAMQTTTSAERGEG